MFNFRHVARAPDYLWVAEDGMKMQGYNGSQLWDTSFAIQAICATCQFSEFKETLRKAHQYLHATQVLFSPRRVSGHGNEAIGPNGGSCAAGCLLQTRVIGGMAVLFTRPRLANLRLHI